MYRAEPGVPAGVKRGDRLLKLGVPHAVHRGA
jgi:hypothetical protein